MGCIIAGIEAYSTKAAQAVGADPDGDRERRCEASAHESHEGTSAGQTTAQLQQVAESEFGRGGPVSAQEIDPQRRQDLLVVMRDLPVPVAEAARRVPGGGLSILDTRVAETHA